MSEDPHVFDETEREEIRDLYDGLRVTDVTDGLDFFGFHDQNTIDREIQPLWRDYDEFAHSFVGFAHTVRFLPTNKRRELPATEDLDFETTTAWRDEWYGDLSGDPSGIREGDVIMMEAHEIDVGIIGSMNSLAWMADGAVAVVTNGGPRDTDEIVKQGLPIYAKCRNKPIIPGRCEFDAEQVPVNLGGAQVRCDDVVVGDGDGVVVVPHEWAREVGEAAAREQSDDQESRRRYYEEVGLEPDFTLE